MIGLIAIFAYNWRLTLVVLSLIPVIAVCMFLQGFCMRILTEKELIALADAMSKADETLSNIRTVRSFVAEEKEIGNYADKINVSYLISKKRAWISGGLSSFTNLAGDTCILVAMWYGGHMIFANEMSVGGLVSYMLFALQSVFAFSSLISIFPQFMEVRSGLPCLPRGIPGSLVSRAAWHPMQRAIPCGLVSRSVWYSRAARHRRSERPRVCSSCWTASRP